MKSVKLSLLIFMNLFFSNIEAEVSNLTSEELITAQKEGVVVIDIRTPEEWQEVGTVPNAKRIMFFDQRRQPRVSEFMTEFEKIVTSKDQAFILVCRTGSRTGVVSKFLDEKVGYTNAAHLAKGMKKWVAEKHEVEKDLKSSD